MQNRKCKYLSFYFSSYFTLFSKLKLTVNSCTTLAEKRKARSNSQKYSSGGSCRNRKDCWIQQNGSLEEASLILGNRNSISSKETKGQKASKTRKYVPSEKLVKIYPYLFKEHWVEPHPLWEKCLIHYFYFEISKFHFNLSNL